MAQKAGLSWFGGLCKVEKGGNEEMQKRHCNPAQLIDRAAHRQKPSRQGRHMVKGRIQYSLHTPNVPPHRCNSHQPLDNQPPKTHDTRAREQTEHPTNFPFVSSFPLDAPRYSPPKNRRRRRRRHGRAPRTRVSLIPQRASSSRHRKMETPTRDPPPTSLLSLLNTPTHSPSQHIYSDYRPK